MSDSLRPHELQHARRRKWQPIPVFLPGESQGWGNLVGCRLWGRTESDTTEATWQQQQRLAGGTLSASFWCLCQKLSLSLIYFNKTLLHKSSEQPSLVTGPRLNSSALEVKNPGAFHGSATIFQEPAHECSQQNYSQKTKSGINPHVHQLMKRYRKRCSLQTMGAKGTKSWHMQRHGWTLKMLGYVKELTKDHMLQKCPE